MRFIAEPPNAICVKGACYLLSEGLPSGDGELFQFYDREKEGELQHNGIVYGGTDVRSAPRTLQLAMQIATIS